MEKQSPPRANAFNYQLPPAGRFLKKAPQKLFGCIAFCGSAPLGLNHKRRCIFNRSESGDMSIYKVGRQSYSGKSQFSFEAPFGLFFEESNRPFVGRVAIYYPAREFPGSAGSDDTLRAFAIGFASAPPSRRSYSGQSQPQKWFQVVWFFGHGSPIIRFATDMVKRPR